MITAKIECTRKVDHAAGTEHAQSTVSFMPDYRDGRNAEWAAATPSLSLTMTLRGDVADRFQVGKRYMLMFEPSPD